MWKKVVVNYLAVYLVESFVGDKPEVFLDAYACCERAQSVRPRFAEASWESVHLTRRCNVTSESDH